MTIDRSGLNQGDYSGTISLTSNGGSADVIVNMSVPGSPALSVSPDTLNFGTSTTVKTFTVSNNGGGTLTWTGAENPDKSWITSVSPTSGSLSSGASATVTVTIDRSGLNQGDYSGTISLTSNGGSADVIVTISVPSTPGWVRRVNAGGPAYSGSGKDWSADQPFSSGSWGYVGGQVATTNHGISNTVDDKLYQSVRWGLTGYRFTLPSNGHYSVVLHFAEIYHTASGRRIFDVSLEGSTVLDDYDVFAAVGHDAADVCEFEVDVTDGVLDIIFSVVKNYPIISAIEVSSVTLNKGLPETSNENSEQTTLPESLPEKFYISNAIPNPFNSKALFKLELNKSGFVRAAIYNLTGQEIKRLNDMYMPAGYNYLHWYGSNEMGEIVSSGIYLLRVDYITGFNRHETIIKRLVFIK